MKMSIARRIGAAVTLVFATALCAADTEAPAGPVVLTVAGNIANTNRPAYNEKRDVFLKYFASIWRKLMGKRLLAAMLKPMKPTSAVVQLAGSAVAVPRTRRSCSGCWNETAT